MNRSTLFRILVRLFFGSLFLVPASHAAESTAKPAAEISGAPVCKSTERSKPMVKLTTNYGVITVEVDAEKAPATAANFLDYVKSGFYDGTIFHRVIDGFMIHASRFAWRWPAC